MNDLHVFGTPGPAWTWAGVLAGLGLLLILVLLIVAVVLGAYARGCRRRS